MIIGRGEKIFLWVIYIVVTIFSLTILYPFINIIAISLNDGVDALRGGIYLWPRRFSLAAYEQVFSRRGLLNAAGMSIARTMVGTIAGLAFTAVLAYLLSKRDLVFRRGIIFLFVFTMYFSGGMIPDFILIRQLGLMNSFGVYIIPALLGVWNVMIMRQFFEELPQSLKDSARVDGANELTVLLRIVLPISKPVLATIALFIAVWQWNAWYDTFIYTSGARLSTLQNELVRILTEQQALVMAAPGGDMRDLAERAQRATPQTIQMATIVITTIPIVLIYPFLQKYFVKGIMVGAVKE
ncbi:MAG: carbohydrate ABC transporter permease [Defluviitaleaceae bacterium]|nr:carbohydrate ABC transporter permease [Defluviitaleaceae bacterium]